MKVVVSSSVQVKVEPPATVRVYMAAGNAMPLSITEVELPEGSSTGDHQHDTDQLVYVLDGEARFVGEGEEHHLRRGDLIYIPAGTVHRHECAGVEPLRQLSIFVKPAV